MWNKQYIKLGFNAQRKYPNENLITFIKRNNIKEDVLEIGCGSGANIWFLAKECKNVYGFDYAPEGLELCKRMLKKWDVEATVELGDMTKPFKYKDSSFNAIVDVVSLQHIEEKEQCLKEVYRCLRKGGKFFSYHIFAGNIKELFSEYTFYLPNEIPKYLKEIGFKNINLEKNIRTYNNTKQEIEYLIITATK